MLEALTRPSRALLAGGLASLAIAGCGANRKVSERPLKTELGCHAVDLTHSWSVVERAQTYEVEAVAVHLGVTPDQVTAGTWGPVYCDQGIPGVEFIGSGLTRAVQGVSDNCYLFRPKDTPPLLNQRYHALLATCPAEGSLA
jgi:hypothetical protein